LKGNDLTGCGKLNVVKEHDFTGCGKTHSGGRPGIHPRLNANKINAGFSPWRVALVQQF
jgi:hypothetical protein